MSSGEKWMLRAVSEPPIRYGRTMQSSDLDHRLTALEAELRRARRRTKLVLVIAVIAFAWACKSTTSGPPEYLEVRDASGAIARLDADGLVFHNGLGEASYGPLQLSIASKDATAKAELGPTHFELGSMKSEAHFAVLTSARQATMTLGNTGTTSAELRVDGAAVTPAGKQNGSISLELSSHLSRFAVSELEDVDVAFFGQGGYALHGSTATGEWECKHDGQPCKK
jgi:hypothetical protein